MAGFLTSSSVSLANGSKTVNLTGSVNCSNVVSGTAVYINGELFEGVAGTASDPSGNSTITLRNTYTGTSITGGTLVAFNTIEGLRDAIQRARDLSTQYLSGLDSISSNLIQFEDFTTATGSSITLELPNGDVVTEPYEYLRGRVTANDLKVVAMTQAQFETNRAIVNEEMAASGFTKMGKHTAGININDGLYTSTTISNQLLLGGGASGDSRSTNSEVNIAGVITQLSHLNSTTANQCKIKTPQAPDGKTTYNKSTGVNTTYVTPADAFNAAALDPTNVEVVTDRVDMWGFEAFLEEVSVANPYVYPNGLIQSLATTMDGIATSASNRPDTYYAWFDGDASSKGKGVNYFTLTDAQKRKVLSNYKNKLYFLDDGRLVQWRLRGRSFAGAGNEDWLRIESNTAGTLAATSFLTVKPQCTSNTVSTGTYNDTSVTPLGHYVSSNTSISANGQAHFLVCGTVNRLNQGAYHPSFNPSGTASWRSAQQSYWCCNWYNGDGRTKLSGEPSNKSDCFTAILGSSVNGGFGNIGVAAYDGYGRTDGRFYDAIYASGQGGVCRDMRYSANHTTLEKFDEADFKVKIGAYRGFEKLVCNGTKVVISTAAGVVGGVYLNNGYINVYPLGSTVSSIVDTKPSDTLSRFNWIFIRVSDGKLIKPALWSNKYNTRLLEWNGTQWVGCTEVGSAYNGEYRGYWYNGRYPAATHPVTSLFYTGASEGIFGMYFMENHPAPTKLVNSVGGSFLQIDVVGNPANILLTDALKNGWEGSWIPQIPTGVQIEYQFTRKLIGTELMVRETTNNGVSWSSAFALYDSSKNSRTTGHLSSSVLLYQYQAFAKQTEGTTNDVVYGGYSGVKDVWTSSGYRLGEGVLLGESLLGVIQKTSNLTPRGAVLKLHNSFLQFDGAIETHFDYTPKHQPLILAIENNSPAFKALNYYTKTNQQAGINYAATELKHDGTDWGDDSQIHIVNNENTLTDLNGNTVKVVTHKLKEPIGWIKVAK